jgi:DNA modification methylase
MHDYLDGIWEECSRILTDGGIACINIGDATRKIGGDFQLFPNHARITSSLTDLGLRQLPGILWRKPTNSAAKFMGSGMLGLNAYVTLEHEHILVFRKGSNRSTSGKETDHRRESAYFWEERNDWFSDIWMDLKGTRQSMPEKYEEARERSGAFPLELPLRLIEMFSVYGDTVLDPFAGTGTTQLAAAMTARSSIGYEIVQDFQAVYEERMQSAEQLSRSRNQRRLEDHVQFVEERKKKGKAPKHTNEFYNFGVTSAQEKRIKLYDVAEMANDNGTTYRFAYEPHLIQTNMFAGAA